MALAGPKWSWVSLYPPPAETEGQMDKTRKLLGQNTRACGGVRGGTERQGVPQPHIRKTQGAPWSIRDPSLGCLGRGRNGLINPPQLLSAQIPTPPLRLSPSHFKIPGRGQGIGMISPTLGHTLSHTIALSALGLSQLPSLRRWSKDQFIFLLLICGSQTGALQDVSQLLFQPWTPHQLQLLQLTFRLGWSQGERGMWARGGRAGLWHGRGHSLWPSCPSFILRQAPGLCGRERAPRSLSS